MDQANTMLGLFARGAAACALALLSAGCEQPRPKCTVARGDFAATYTLLSSYGDCGEPLLGDVLSVQAYYGPRSQRDQSPNYSETAIGIQPLHLTDLLAAAGDRASPDPADVPYALGSFARSEPDQTDTCNVAEPSTARVRLPAIPAYTDDCGVDHEAQPAQDVSYEFRNVRVLVTAAATGTHLTAKLTYRQPDCWATYDVTAVYPAIACEADLVMSDAGMDAASMPPATSDAGNEDASVSEDCAPPEPTSGLPDDAKCGAGSGINPDFRVHCDPQLLMCVLDGEAK